MGMAILTRLVKALVALIDHNPKQYWSIYQSPCTRVSWLGIGAPILTRLIESIYLINHNPLPFHLSTRIRYTFAIKIHTSIQRRVHFQNLFHYKIQVYKSLDARPIA